MKPAPLQVRLRADHPAANGHFPGNPVIPGAVLLDEVLVALGARLDRAVSGCIIRSAKFLHPVRPGDVLDVDFAERAGGVEFACRRGNTEVMKGEVRWTES